MPQIPSVTIEPKGLSNFDLSYINRMTMNPGTGNVAYWQLCQPGSTYAVEPRHLVQSMPMKTPMLGRMALQLDWFFVPLRLYCRDMQINDLNLAPSQTDFKLASYKLCNGLKSTSSDLSRLAPTPDEPINPTLNDWYNHYRIRETSLLNQIDLPAGYIDMSHNESTRTEINACKLIGYYDIFRNYYAFNQEPNFYFYRNDGLSLSNYGDPYYFVPSEAGNDSGVVQWSLKALNTLFAVGEQISYTDPRSGSSFSAPRSYSQLAQNLYEWFANGMCANSGLWLRTYKSDYFTQWLSKSEVDTTIGNQQLMAVTTAYGAQGITINQFRTANKLTKRAEAITASGGHYDDIVQVDFGVSTNQQLNIPEFLGSSTTYIDFQNIASTTPGATKYEPTDGEYPLGAQAGKGISYSGNEAIFVNPSEWGYLMAICSLVPIPDYYQGIHKDATKVNYSDLHSPWLDNLGFQALTESEFYALPQITRANETSQVWYPVAKSEMNPFEKGVAYQPAWFEHMTRTNELHGQLCSDLRFWTLGRDMTHGSFDDLHQSVDLPVMGYATPSVYVFPQDYQLPFVGASDDTHNFIVQFAFDVFAEQQVSKRLMPNAR